MRTFALLREWQRDLALIGRVGPETARQYLRGMLTALTIVVEPPEGWTEADVLAVLKGVTARGGYRDQVTKAMMSYFRWQAKRLGIPDPTTDLYIRKRRAGPPAYLSREELERLFVAAEDVDPRARPTLELMYATAARIGSIVELRPTDIDLTARTVSFVLGVKNGATYSLPLSARGYAAAVRLLELGDYHPPTGKRRAGKLVGVGEETVRIWMRRAGAAAGITQRLYPHLLRHSAITHLSRDPDVSVATIVRTANWQDPSPWNRYAAARQRDVKEALSRL